MAMENPCSENFPASQASFAKGKHDQYPIIIQFLAHDHPLLNFNPIKPILNHYIDYIPIKIPIL